MGFGREAPDVSLRVLHVGCGTDPLPDWLQQSSIIETRLDLDQRVAPDIVADLTDLGDIGVFDVVYSSHTLEHLHPSKIHSALTEMHRVLDADGRMLCIVPDLEDVKPTTDVLYVSAAGPMCGLDLIYGWHGVTADNPLMRHQSGFTRETLEDCMRSAGFNEVNVERLSNYQLLGSGIK